MRWHQNHTPTPRGKLSSPPIVSYCKTAETLRQPPHRWMSENRPRRFLCGGVGEKVCNFNPYAVIAVVLNKTGAHVTRSNEFEQNLCWIPTFSRHHCSTSTHAVCFSAICLFGVILTANRFLLITLQLPRHPHVVAQHVTIKQQTSRLCLQTRHGPVNYSAHSHIFCIVVSIIVTSAANQHIVRTP